MREPKGNKNAKRSENLIKRAFIQLLCEKSYSKITVTDVITKAPVSRATFYAHYPDLDGLLESVENDLVNEFVDHFKSFGIKKAIRAPGLYVRIFLENYESKIDYFRMLADSENAASFFADIGRMLKESILNTMENAGIEINSFDHLSFLFYYDALTNLLYEFICGNIDVSWEDLMLSISSMLPRGYEPPGIKYGTMGSLYQVQ